MELPPDILIEALGFAALIGASWWRLGALGDKVDENNDLIRAQNGRISRLEEWKAGRDGYRRGLEEGTRSRRDDV